MTTKLITYCSTHHEGPCGLRNRAQVSWRRYMRKCPSVEKLIIVADDVDDTGRRAPHVAVCGAASDAKEVFKMLRRAIGTARRRVTMAAKRRGRECARQP